jgi:hypothetical protein
MDRRSTMKMNNCIKMLMILGLTLFAGCASMQVWPDDERSAENKMTAIEGRIGEGLQTGGLTPDQSQMYLTTLKGIRTDYEALRDRIVYQEKWNSLHNRLDALGDDIDRAYNRTVRIEEPRDGERIAALQRVIDNGRINRRMSSAEEREFQTRLDSIRNDYLRITDRGRPATYEARADISRRLESLAIDLDRYR